MLKKFKVFTMALIAFTLMTTFIPVMGENVGEEPETGEGTDKSTFLNDSKYLTFTVKQGTEEKEENDPIDISKPIRVDIDLDVVLEAIGDDDPSKYIARGDFANLVISNKFNVKSDLEFFINVNTDVNGSVKDHHFATVKITNEIDDGNTYTNARIDFDGLEALYNKANFHSANVKFYLDLEYAGDGDFSGEGNDIFEILGKEFKLTRPDDTASYSVKKDGKVNKLDKTVTWTVTVDGDLTAWNNEKTKFDFTGKTFKDDLSNAGKYVDDSLRLVDENDKEITIGDLSSDDNELKFTFPEGSKAVLTVTYDTELTDKEYFGNDKVVKTNIAYIYDGDTPLDKDNGKAEYNPEWIKKTGGSSNTSAKYDPINEIITWTITINSTYAKLDNVIVTDNIPEELKWVSAVATYTTDEPKEKTFDQDPGGVYDLGKITGEVTLTILTKVIVADGDYVIKEGKITNKATVSWDGQGDGKYDADHTVGVGYNPIKKSGKENTKDQTVEWNITVDTKGQDKFPKELTVYDLIVHGEDKSALSNIEYQSNNITPENFKYLVDNTNTVNQKFESKMADNENVTVEVEEIKDGTKHIADLLIFKLHGKDKYNLSFKTKIVNPAITLGNKESNIKNKAFLFSGDEYLSNAEANVKYLNNLIAKEMIDRDAHVDIPETKAANNIAKSLTEGYNYETNTVIYRLNVNRDGIDISDIEDSNGNKMGKVTIVDTLPKDWDFVPINGSEMYLIYDAENDLALNLSDLKYKEPLITKSDEDNPAKMSLTFESLDKQYIILVKAKPSDDLIKEYFSKNHSVTVKNLLTLNTEHYELKKPVNSETKIKSKILDKDAVTVEDTNGLVAKWTVTFNPYFSGQLPEVMTITDTLPQGIELQVDSNGDFVEGSIQRIEYDINNDGTLGAAKEPENYTPVYDSEKRTVIFDIEDTDKAYKFTYLTDVVHPEGDIVNEVKLEGKDFTNVDDDKTYTIEDESSSGSIKRLGSFKVHKINDQNEGLEGVEFTLSSEDNKTIIRTFSTDNKGELDIRGLREGKYLLEETLPKEGYVSSGLRYLIEVIVPEIGPSITKVNGEVIDDALVIVNHLEGKNGSLELKKAIRGNGASNTDVFEFTIEFGIADGAKVKYLESSTSLVKEFTNGGTIELKADESVKFVDLPLGTTYKITEADYSDDGYVKVDPIEGEISFYEDEVNDNDKYNTIEEVVNEKHNKVTLKKVSENKEVIKDSEIRFTLFKKKIFMPD